MDLRRLSIFLEVIDQGSFTAAADVIGCSQPAVSQAIRELERDLGTPLFHRIGRQIRLTPAGGALVGPARRLSADVELSRAAVRAVAGLEEGRLDLACLPTLAAAPLAPLVGRFHQSHPGLLVTLAAPEDTEELLDLVRGGRAEIGIVDDAPAADLTMLSMGRQDFLVVSPPGSPTDAALTLEDISARSFVAPPRGTSSRRLLDDALASVGVTARVGVEASQREALLPLILAGAGTGLLPRPLAEHAALLGCAVSSLSPPVYRELTLVHRPGPLTPAARAFVRLAHESSSDAARGVTSLSGA